MRVYYVRFLKQYRNEEKECVEIVCSRTSCDALRSILKRFPRGTNIKLLECRLAHF